MNLKEYIEKAVLVFDGAMGTYYASIKNNSLKKCELANIYDKGTVLQIHKEYVNAGCMAIKTNTFGANKICLESDFDVVKQVIKSGYEIAIEAVDGTDAFVFADIGPIPFSEDKGLFEDYKKIIDTFLDLGAENFIFETFNSYEYLQELSEYIKSIKPNAFILAQFAVSPEGFTRIGLSGKKIFDTLSKSSSIDALGFNCVSGPFHLFQYIKTVDISGKIVSVMPNAGYPTVINNRTFFENNAEYFATQMINLAKQGVSILGGCCGTTPAFINETVKKLRYISTSGNKIVQNITIREKKKSDNRNVLLDKLSSGKKIIAVELDPPVDTDISFFTSSAKRLKEIGADAITIADCPIARARVDSSLLACKLKRELDITAIPHMTCRDRNINATKALLLGLNIENVNNVLVVTGDPIPSAERDEVKAMFSFNSSVLANYIKNLNETVFPTPFNICGALNVNTKNFDSQLSYAKKKIENGVTMFLTQPILTEEAFYNLKNAREALPAKILGGIMPIVSHRNACFMNNEISGITVSEEIIDMYKDITKETAAELAVKLSTDVAKKISPYVDGYYLITPFKRIDIIEEIMNNIKALA